MTDTFAAHVEQVRQKSADHAQRVGEEEAARRRATAAQNAHSDACRALGEVITELFEGDMDGFKEMLRGMARWQSSDKPALYERRLKTMREFRL